MAEEIKFIDAESYQGGGQDKITFSMIALEHLRRIISLGSKEWKGGYWETTEKMLGSVGYTEKRYISDTREEYFNAIEQMAIILSPHFDEIMIKDEEEINKEKDKEPAIKEKIELYGYYFRRLNRFLKKQDYMKSKGFEDNE